MTGPRGPRVRGYNEEVSDLLNVPPCGLATRYDTVTTPAQCACTKYTDRTSAENRREPFTDFRVNTINSRVRFTVRVFCLSQVNIERVFSLILLSTLMLCSERDT